MDTTEIRENLQISLDQANRRVEAANGHLQRIVAERDDLEAALRVCTKIWGEDAKRDDAANAECEEETSDA